MFFSVALSRELPPADVIRYPCPWELGLSSGRTFRRIPAIAPLAVYYLLMFGLYSRFTKRLRRPNRGAAEGLSRHLRRNIRPERRPNRQVFCELCGIFLPRERFFPF